MIRAALLTAALLSAPMILGAQAEPDPVIPFADDDAEMNAAIAEAQRTLPLFLLNSVDEDGYGHVGGYLKVGFPVKNAEINVENIWVGPFAVSDGENFIGLLANEPVAMGGLHSGDQVSFDYDMIVDWSIANESGTTWGDYTTRVIVDGLPAKQAAELAARFANPPVPASWRDAAK